MKKNFLRPNGMSAGYRYLSNNYYDNYTNMECSGCRAIIPYDAKRCPKCGLCVDQTAQEVKTAKRRKRTDAMVALTVCIVSILLVIFIIYRI